MNVKLIMPSQNPELKKSALTTLMNNTTIPVTSFVFPDLINRGWIGGCNLGMEAAKDYDYIILANDDILVPNVCDWGKVMIDTMEGNKHIGALSVLTMNAMGWAKLNPENCIMRQPYEVPFCSFFFVMIRGETARKVGLLDNDLPGGDDLDYCLRIKDAGWKIAITPQVFIWHHYGQTGKKIYGDYWDSPEYAEKINMALIRKHGFSKFTYNQYLGDK